MHNPTKTPEELLQAWGKGKSLEGALNKFTNKNILREYKSVPVPIYDAKLDSTVNDFSALIQNFLNPAQNYLNLKGSSRINLNNNLFQKLSHGRLIALGYEEPRKSSDFPVVIPQNIWPPEKINWKKSLIKENNLEFSSVRIVTLSVYNNTIFAAPRKANRGQGRPSKGIEINKAYDELKNEGTFKDYSLPFTKHIDDVQYRVMKNTKSEDIKGINHKAIQKWCSKKYQSDKEKYHKK